MLAVAVVFVSYAIGSVPVAYVVGRLAKGIDIREVGSGNVGASNVWQSVSRWLVAPVGLAQIGQGLAGVLIAKAANLGDGAQVAAGVAAVVAHNWSPWLGFTGGRGVGPAIGVLLGVSPVALATFIAVALAGVALRMIPQGVGAGIAVSPLAAALSDASSATAAGCAVLAAVLLAKRLTANGAPSPEYSRPGVWWHRLLYDRDTPDREAWVRRGIERDERARSGT